MNEQSVLSRARIVKTESEGDGYYDWLAHTVAIRGQQVRLYTKPGIAGFQTLDQAAALLAENLAIQSGAAILTLNCGPGLVGTVAARLAGDGAVTLIDPNCVAVAAARRTVEANQVKGVQIFEVGNPASLSLEPVDLVALRLPKGKPRLKQLLWEGFRALRPGGRLYLAGGNQEGIKTALAMAEALFGRVSLLGYRKGFRVGSAVKESETPPDPASFIDPWLASGAFVSFSVQIRGQEVQIRSRPGVFSWDRIDGGTAQLLEVLRVQPGDSVLDLGCGYGLIGVVAARLAPDVKVTLVDADAAAIEAANATLLANHVQHGRAVLQDCGAGLADASFDIVATNPPFHQGKKTDYDVGRQFVKEAARVLKPGGVLFLVANRFLPYEAQVEKFFGNVQQVTLDSRYKVLFARKGEGILP